MNFNALEFLVLFLPVTLAAFYAAPARARLWVLVVASLIFYGVSGPIVLAAFVFAIAWGMGTAFLFGRTPKWLAVSIAVAGPLFFLVMFKYLDFILDSAGAGEAGPVRDALWPFLSITLPAGISFYTFQIMSYSIDVADGKIPRERNLARFAAFASFFPQLIAGPIMRYEDLGKQLGALTENVKLAPNIVGGVKFLAIGLFAKVFFADISGMGVDVATQTPLADLTAIDQATQIGFWSMQIYYDFWSYSIMAIGLGRLFCIELPLNFREPYLSANPREFWRRWHVTLSYWLRDYLYIRLGGNKAYMRNILIVFAVVGLWHGAGWNFVAWGVYHGVLVVAYHLTRKWWDRIPAPLATALTFVLVSMGWPLFFLSLGDYAAFLAHMGQAVMGAETGAGVYGVRQWAYLGALGLFTFGLREKDWLHTMPGDAGAGAGGWWRRLLQVANSPVLAGMMMFAAMVFLSLSKTFIYFRF